MGMRRQSAAKVLKLVGKNGDGSMMGAYPDGARASSIQQRACPALEPTQGLLISAVIPHRSPRFNRLHAGDINHGGTH